MKKLIILLIICCVSCKEVDMTPITTQVQYPGWETTSHGQVEPAYDVVFPKEKLQTIEITISKVNWDNLNAKQTENYFGITFGTAFNKITPKQNQLLNNNYSGSFVGKNPTEYVEAEVKFNDKIWKNVGLKYDGFIPLFIGWSSGFRKLPFQIQANTFEKKYSETTGQKIYGFQNLSLDPSSNDNAIISNKLSSDIFNDNGISCPRKSFCKLYIDYGEGKKYFGLYTLSELPEDTFVKKNFGDNSGNIYQPTSSLKTFQRGYMVKKNNVVESNFIDIETLISVLNSSKRISDKAVWLERINKNFDVDTYLKWLAINTAIRGDENHDEGFGLYNKADRKLSLFPYQTSYCFRFPSTTANALPDTEILVDLGYTKASEQYPLIKYLLAEPTYFETYKQYLKEFNSKYFIPEKINAMIDQNLALVSTAVAEEIPPFSQLRSQTQFNTGIKNMRDFVPKQKVLLNEFLK